MEVRQHHHPHRRCLGRRAWASCCRGDAIVVKIFSMRTHGLRAMTGAPWPPGSLDSSRRGQTCRVVFVGQMTSRRSGESLRDRIGTARPRGRPEGPHIPGRLSSERTRGRRHRHSGQPTRAPTTRAAADPTPSPIPNLSLLLNTARKRPRRRGPRVFPAPPTQSDLPRSSQ